MPTCVRSAACLLVVVLIAGCVTDATRGSPRACPIHARPLKADTVRVVYGLPAEVIDEVGAARQTRFPYASTHVSGGCVRGRPAWYRVMYCRDCRRARATYFRDEMPAVIDRLREASNAARSESTSSR